jgi:trimeric autotransporter adhesin
MKKLLFTSFAIFSLFSISDAQIINTIAGYGFAGNSGDGGPATAVEINYPYGLKLDATGNLIIAEYAGQVVREVNTSGIISTLAGNGVQGFWGDGGPATAAEFYNVCDMALDNSGNIYITDERNNRIRKVNTSGIITTIAGNGVYGFAGDGGAAISSEMAWPAGICLDTAGNIYIADYFNSAIRKINTSGTISTIAGHGGTSGFSGDGGQQPQLIYIAPSVYM